MIYKWLLVGNLVDVGVHDAGCLEEGHAGVDEEVK